MHLVQVSNKIQGSSNEIQAIQYFSITARHKENARPEFSSFFTLFSPYYTIKKQIPWVLLNI